MPIACSQLLPLNGWMTGVSATYFDMGAIAPNRDYRRTQGTVAPPSNHALITARSASVMPVALFNGMVLVTTACW